MGFLVALAILAVKFFLVALNLLFLVLWETLIFTVCIIIKILIQIYIVVDLSIHQSKYYFYGGIIILLPPSQLVIIITVYFIFNIIL